MPENDDAPPDIAGGWRAPRRDRERLASGVGANVRRLRRRRGLNQAALAAAIGRDRSTVSRWESGERIPSLPSLVALGRALGCDPAALIAGAEPGAEPGTHPGEG